MVPRCELNVAKSPFGQVIKWFMNKLHDVFWVLACRKFLEVVWSQNEVYMNSWSMWVCLHLDSHVSVHLCLCRCVMFWAYTLPPVARGGHDQRFAFGLSEREREREQLIVNVRKLHLYLSSFSHSTCKTEQCWYSSDILARVCSTRSIKLLDLILFELFNVPDLKLFFWL